jgi:hypothetical protein
VALMARYNARNLDETIKFLTLIGEKDKKLLAQTKSAMPRVLMGTGQINQARAQEIIQEKGHVDTGNLVRSINTQLGELSEERTEVLVGTFVIYAGKIENLPDGGYMFESTQQTMPLQIKYLVENDVKPAIVEWGR